jgi:hypothetical protein
MKWYFSPQLPGQVETEVTQRDQFSNDEVNLSETIVRESIQNSLDAAADTSIAIKVSFRWLDKTNGLESEFFEQIFDQQLKHAKEAGLDTESVDFNNPTALVIEDFGTKGLTGSISEKDDDNFSDFWRRHGKSHKTGKSRGRWGLGKLVYSTTSQLGVFFGATHRANDSCIHVMGQTVLNLRKVDGKEYPPHGFFADIEGEDLYTEIPVPLKDSELVEKFVSQFSLKRQDDNGLSVIIPFPNPDFSIEAMIGVAIVNYFYPVITRQLVLQFNGTEINNTNIRELAHKYAADSISDIDKVFDFIEEAYSIEEKDLLVIKPSWADDAMLSEDDFEPEDLESIREKFTSEQLVGLRLPVTVKKKNGTPLATFFSVFIKRPAELSKGSDLYVRGGLTLPGEAKFRERKALGVMVAEDETICSFLGDAENAAHTLWIASAEKLYKNYQNPSKTVKVIKNSIVQLYDMLAEVVDEVDEEALRSFFWINEPEGTQARKKQKKTPIVIPDPPKPRPKDFHISEAADGFSIVSTKDAEPDRFPQIIRIEVAYDVATGNPFKKYNPLDFKLGKSSGINLSMTGETAKLISNRENVIRLEVTKLPFKFNASGFDVNRDLKIKLLKEA